MLLLAICLGIISLMLIIADHRSSLNRWGSLTAFLGGCGGLAVFLDQNVLPYINSNSEFIAASMLFVINMLTSFSYYLTAWALLMTTLAISSFELKFDWEKRRQLLAAVFAFPAVLMYVIYPVHPLFQPEYRILTLWVAPYVLAANVLVVYAFLKTKDETRRIQNLFACIIIVPPTLFALFTNYILDIKGAWEYNTYIIVFQFAAFLTAAYKYGVLGIKISVEKYRNAAFPDMINQMSDAFAFIDDNLNIVESNVSFRETFGNCAGLEAVLSNYLANFKAVLLDFINGRSKQPLKTEVFTTINDVRRYFNIEASNIFIKSRFCGTMVLFEDVTENKKNVELLIERERLLSLNQLIGGIAHNLKTPLTSCSGGLMFIKSTLRELEEHLENYNEEKFGNMQAIYTWIENIKQSLIYMNDVITAVREQTVETDAEEFTLEGLFDKVFILLEYELKTHQCTICKHIKVDKDVRIRGELSSLVQVLNNVMLNAMESYEGTRGVIDLEVTKENDSIKICIMDYGKGIPEKVLDKIFKEMITTKGKAGTGLGLYISNIVIKGKFNGIMRIQSVVNKGTTVYIEIPVRV